MPEMDIVQLEYFLAVARLENMTTAAASLHVAQSSVSRCISRLEDHLGVPLFDRRGNGIALNERRSLLSPRRGNYPGNGRWLQADEGNAGSKPWKSFHFYLRGTADQPAHYTAHGAVPRCVISSAQMHRFRGDSEDVGPGNAGLRADVYSVIRA